jgi:hypothetical protein
MRSKPLLVTILAVIALCLGTSQATADLLQWTTVEPDEADSMPFDYSDGIPQHKEYPCEIFGMTLTTNTDIPNVFSFDIQTNFGDLTERQIWSQTWTTGDSYNGGVGLDEFITGDLYILVRSKLGFTSVYDDPVHGKWNRLYGLAFESRTGTQGNPTDSWETTLANAGYFYAAKNAGDLFEYQPDLDMGFATGTYEGYEGLVEEIPEMALAQALPGLYDVPTEWQDLQNSYPTILLDGVYASSGNVVWETTREPGEEPSEVPLGYWSGDFTLPTFNPDEEYLEVWWSMHCGNDAVRISTGEPIPLPSSLLLCGIGLGFLAAARPFRRKK